VLSRPAVTAAGARSAVAGQGRGGRWYLGEGGGGSRGGASLTECAEQGPPPVSRREFERRRADALESNPVSRCC